MPELPEVETVKRGLAGLLAGETIESVELRRKDLRIPFPKHFASRLQGRKIERVERRAKYLLFYLEDGLVLLAHLGMSGRFRVEGGKPVGDRAFYNNDSPSNDRHDHVVFRLSSRRRLIYNDARRFGLMELLAANDLVARFNKIGIEPLSKAFDDTRLRNLLADKKAPIKIALIDQELIAGIGNIYACEALYEARISPLKPAGKITKSQSARLVTAIKTILKRAIEFGGSSLRDFHDAQGESGAFQREFSVYDRTGKPCPRCGTKIERFVQTGRSTFHCRRC